MPSLEEVAGQTAGGGLMGGILGGAFGGYQGYKGRSKPLNVGDMGGATQQDLPYAGLREPEWYQPPSGLEHEGPMHGPEIGPYGIPNENQGKLPFNIDPQGQGMLFDDAGPTPPPPKPPPPPAGPLGTPPSPSGGINIDMTNPNVIPPGTHLSDNQQVVTITAPDQNNVAFWRARGYVSVQGLVDSEGHPQMVRGDVAPLFVTGDKRPTAPPPQPPTPAPGPISQGQTGIAPGEDHVVPNQVADQAGYRENMERGGYGVAGRTATHTTFREVPLAHADDGSGGAMSPEEVRANFTRMLGREPTEEEMALVLSRQVRPGEQTGRVAQFDRGFEPEENQNPAGLPPVDPAKLQQFATGLRASTENRLGMGEDDPNAPLTPLPPPRAPYGEPRIGGEETGERIAGAFPAPLGPRSPVEGYDIPAPPPPEGQGNLLPGVVERNRLENIANAGNQDISTNVGMLRQEPTQPSMIDDLIDAEIQDRTREGPVPPEMRDLSEYGPDDLLPMRGRPLNIKDALTTKGMDDPVAVAINEARLLGLNPEDFDNLGELQWAIARRVAQEAVRTGKNPLTDPTYNSGDAPGYHHIGIGESKVRVPPEEPLAMGRNALTGKAVFTVNPLNSIKELTGGYSKPLPFVMVREGMQNALDAINTLGMSGEIKVTITDANSTTKKPASIIIEDNGKGMTEDDLYTVFTTLHESGKVSDTSATGGKGVGSVTYILGGQHFKIETVALMPDGTKVKSSFAGKPEDILNPEGFDIKPEVVPDDTPTGTKFETLLKEDQDAWDGKNSMTSILDYSRNRTGKISYKRNPWESVKEHTLTGNPNDKIVATDITLDNGNVKADIIIPEKARTGTFTGTTIQVLNNGMWQFEQWHSYGEEKNGVPSEVVVDLKPQVEELSPEYPFPVQRESVKDHIWSQVTQGVNQYVADPMASNKQKDLAKLWGQMGTVSAPRGGTMRETVFFDNGDRLLPHELDFIKNSPAIRSVQQIIDKLLDDVLVARGISYDQMKLVRSGIYMPDDRYLYGHHIPNPSAPKAESGILLNLFAHILDNPNDPKTAALSAVETLLHEAAHIGKDSPTSYDIVISPKDMNDPRVGRYLATYLRQVSGQLGLVGHGTDWIKRLGDIYAKTGTGTAFQHADALEAVLRGKGAGRGTNLVTPGGRKSGSYSPEIQELLHIYTESRGRPATSEDILSPTGVKSAGARGGGPTTVPSNTPTAGGGTPTQQGVAKKAKEFSWVKEALAVPTNATTMLDLSAPGRQGLSMIATPEFWKASWAMFKGLSYDSYKQIDADLRAKPLMRRRISSDGRVMPSFGEEIGVKMFSPASEGVGPRAEATASKWLEMGIGEGIGSKVWRNTAGVPIRATNRAFITFLNHLNVNRTEKLLNLAKDMSVRGVDTGRTAMPGLLGGVHLKGGENIGFSRKIGHEDAMNMNPYHNLVLAKEIAEFVNAATGHATAKGGLSLENAVSKIGPFLFSPGLLNSRIRMMNPATYVMASPFVRQQYAKAALSTAAAWFISSQLVKNAAGEDAEVSDDITSADFGKVRVGDARLDLGGGFLQFAVAYGRMYMGGSTSSSSGEFHRFGSGYQAQTQEDMMERFLVNKLNPVTKFAWDVFSASEYNPFHVGDRTAQLFVPLFIQDLNEIYKENPDLLPIFGGAAMLGGGTQIYSKGESVAKLIPEENDWLTTGGGVRDLMPWNWGNDPGQVSRPFPWSPDE